MPLEFSIVHNPEEGPYLQIREGDTLYTVDLEIQGIILTSTRIVSPAEYQESANNFNPFK